MERSISSISWIMRGILSLWLVSSSASAATISISRTYGSTYASAYVSLGENSDSDDFSGKNSAFAQASLNPGEGGSLSVTVGNTHSSAGANNNIEYEGWLYSHAYVVLYGQVQMAREGLEGSGFEGGSADGGSTLYQEFDLLIESDTGASGTIEALFDANFSDGYPDFGFGGGTTSMIIYDTVTGDEIFGALSSEGDFSDVSVSLTYGRLYNLVLDTNYGFSADPFEQESFTRDMGASFIMEVAEAAVPIPAGAWLFGSVLAGILGIRKKARI